MNEEARILEKLKRVMALFAGTDVEGERAAAEATALRLQQRLDTLRRSNPDSEYRFTISDPWSRRLLLALLRRQGLKPYRYRGQRYSTIMVKVSAAYVDEVLWPEYVQLDNILREYLEDITSKLISQAVYADVSEAGERVELEAPART